MEKRDKPLFASFRDYRQGIEKLYDKGPARGIYMGFEELSKYYNPVMKATTYIYGNPFSGKSQFLFELLIFMSEAYGYRHAIYSPESGDIEELGADLISKIAGKPFFSGQDEERLDKAEYYRHFEHLADYFYVVDPRTSELSVEKFYEQVVLIESTFDIRINTTTIDPWNELEHDMKNDHGRQDMYLENKLGMVRRNAIERERHNFIVTHCADQQMVKGKHLSGDDLWHYPKPQPKQMSGGQAFFRKGMNIIGVWRPPSGLINNETTMPYEENEVHLIIQKFKPKFTGRLGTVKLYFNPTKNRYYERQYNHERYASKRTVEPTGATTSGIKSDKDYPF